MTGTVVYEFGSGVGRRRNDRGRHLLDGNKLESKFSMKLNMAQPVLVIQSAATTPLGRFTTWVASIFAPSVAMFMLL